MPRVYGGIRRGHGGIPQKASSRNRIRAEERAYFDGLKRRASTRGSIGRRPASLGDVRLDVRPSRRERAETCVWASVSTTGKGMIWAPKVVVRGLGQWPPGATARERWGTTALLSILTTPCATLSAAPDKRGCVRRRAALSVWRGVVGGVEWIFGIGEASPRHGAHTQAARGRTSKSAQSSVFLPVSNR